MANQEFLFNSQALNHFLGARETLTNVIPNELMIKEYNRMQFLDVLNDRLLGQPPVQPNPLIQDHPTATDNNMGGSSIISNQNGQSGREGFNNQATVDNNLSPTPHQPQKETIIIDLKTEEISRKYRPEVSNIGTKYSRGFTDEDSNVTLKTINNQYVRHTFVSISPSHKNTISDNDLKRLRTLRNEINDITLTTSTQTTTTTSTSTIPTQSTQIQPTTIRNQNIVILFNTMESTQYRPEVADIGEKYNSTNATYRRVGPEQFEEFTFNTVRGSLVMDEKDIDRLKIIKSLITSNTSSQPLNNEIKGIDNLGNGFIRYNLNNNIAKLWESRLKVIFDLYNSRYPNLAVFDSSMNSYTFSTTNQSISFSDRDTLQFIKQEIENKRSPVNRRSVSDEPKTTSYNPFKFYKS